MGPGSPPSDCSINIRTSCLSCGQIRCAVFYFTVFPSRSYAILQYTSSWYALTRCPSGEQHTALAEYAPAPLAMGNARCLHSGLNRLLIQSSCFTLISQGAIKFVLSGAHIMCPGLTSPGATIHDEVRSLRV